MIAITKPAPPVQVPEVGVGRTSGAGVVWAWLKFGAAVLVGLFVFLIVTPGTWEAFKEPIQESCHTRQTIGTCDQVGTPDIAPNLNTATPAQEPVGDTNIQTQPTLPAPDVFNENPAPGYTGGDILPPTFEGQ